MDYKSSTTQEKIAKSMSRISICLRRLHRTNHHPEILERLSFLLYSTNAEAFTTFSGHFSRERVNLTRITSRPVPGKPQNYVFFVEIEGSADMPHVAKALKNAKRFADTLVTFGAFAVRPRYKS